jgi:hypothetical protein
MAADAAHRYFGEITIHAHEFRYSAKPRLWR